MREIKFRAWEEDVKFMNDQVRITVNPFGANKTFFEVTDGFNWKEVNPEHVMQFTGLKDKNGKEVYDGDSFKAKHRSGNEYKGYIQKGLSFEFVIKSYSEDFIDGEGIRKTDFTFDINSFVQYFPVDDFEVIGNIYENPELLEESK